MVSIGVIDYKYTHLMSFTVAVTLDTVLRYCIECCTFDIQQSQLVGSIEHVY